MMKGERVSHNSIHHCEQTKVSDRDTIPIHHKNKSLLEDLHSSNGQTFLDMMKDFPVADDLHLLQECNENMFVHMDKGIFYIQEQVVIH